MDIEHLQIELDRMNDLGFGLFRCWEIDNLEEMNPTDRIKEYLSDFRLFSLLRHQYSDESIKESFQSLVTELNNLKLHPINNWEELIKEKTTLWLNFCGPYSPSNYDQDHVNSLKKVVLETTFQYLNKLIVKNAFYIDENFHDYFTPWGDQMCFNIICCSSTKIFIYHTGWSS